MDIYFLRHANAGEAKFSSTKDAKRPIDKLGIEQSHDVQTAAVVANEIGYEDKVITDAALLPGASFQQFRELLVRHSRKEAIMVVGHNPSMTEFLNRILFAEGRHNAVEMKKGSVARVEKVGRRTAVLKWCMPPKAVRLIQQASASSSRPKTVSK